MILQSEAEAQSITQYLDPHNLSSLSLIQLSRCEVFVPFELDTVKSFGWTIYSIEVQMMQHTLKQDGPYSHIEVIG